MTKTSPSDHFDGNRFFNPTLPKGFAPSWRSALKMAREPRSRWPAWVENKGAHRLNETLGADEVAITFVTHATFLIQTGGVTSLTAPVCAQPVRSAKKPVGRLYDRKLGAPRLFRRRHGILDPFLGHQDAPGLPGYRDPRNWQLRAAMVHETDTHESGRGRLRASGPRLQAK